MSTALTLQQWLAGQALPLFFIGFALLMGIVILHLSAVSRRSSRQRDRSGRTEDTFVDELTAYGYDPAIARLTYQMLHEEQRVPFPIEPTDHLERDLGLDPEALDRLTWLLLEETGRSPAPGLLHIPPVTVADLIRHIQATPAHPNRRLHIA